MADDDDTEKTEDPSQRKLSKAHDKGSVAQSQEIKSWAVLLGGGAALMFLAPGIMRDVRAIGYRFIEQPHAIATDIQHLDLTMAIVLQELFMSLWPFLLLLVVLALAASLGQTGLIFTAEKMKPELKKINPIEGFKKKFGWMAVVEFLKGIAKLSIVTAVGVFLVTPLLSDLALTPDLSMMGLLSKLYDITLVLIFSVVGVMTAIAFMDYAWQKFQFTNQMKMSKQEVKDEYKQTEGDPQIKARIRRLRMERANKRMMAAVPQADVVVTNPTHYAVALEYKMDSMAAPRLVAKGVDSLAFKIREVAEEHDIPIVENAPLARALYATVELEEEVPEEHYRAVAEVIGYVMRLKGKLPPQNQPIP